ncbi:MAG: T9SS type A sorting domain-containing protein [Paludibacteraceae bacterium]
MLYSIQILSGRTQRFMSLVCCLCVSVCLSAQTAVVTTGADGPDMTYSIGQAVAGYAESSEGSITIGVLQTYPLTIDQIPNVENNLQADVSVYPNPTSALLHILTTGEQPIDCEVIGSNGQIIMRATSQPATFTLNFSTLPAGIYLLRLITADKLQQNTFQIIKK